MYTRKKHEKTTERGLMQGRTDCRLELKKGLGFHRQSLLGKCNPVAEQML